MGDVPLAQSLEEVVRDLGDHGRGPSDGGVRPVRTFGYPGSRPDDMPRAGSPRPPARCAAPVAPTRQSSPLTMLPSVSVCGGGVTLLSSTGGIQVRTAFPLRRRAFAQPVSGGRCRSSFLTVRAVTALQLLSLCEMCGPLSQPFGSPPGTESNAAGRTRLADRGDQLRANSRRSALNRSANFGTIARPCGAPGYTL